MASLRGRMHSENRKPSFRRDAASESTPLLRNGTNGTGSGQNPDSTRVLNQGDGRNWAFYPKHVLSISWQVLASNYVNVFLVFVPLGIISGVLKWGPIAIFTLNFIAIIPLAGLLSFATEELSAEMGQTIGGLCNASFGNAVELIVAVIALARGQIRIVQAGMLGSILSNSLLVLGCCFVAGGWRGGQQDFNETVAGTMASLLAVASMSLIIPAALSASMSSSKVSSKETILELSRGTAIILLLLYMLYLFFQLKTHSELFDEENAPVDEDEDEEPRVLKPIPAAVTLLLITITVAVCADFLVGSIDDVVASTNLSRTFIGLILLPIVGNAAEHVTACIVAYKGKMDLAIGVALGSSLQIALFVTPLMVIVGWIIHQPMTLHFHSFETVVFLVSVLVVNYLIIDGRSNYLEGAMCLGTYFIIAMAFYMYPDDATDFGSALSSRWNL